MSPSPTLLAALDRAAALDRPGAGLRFLDRREALTALSWAEVRGRALRAAAGLRAKGIGDGDRVALILTTGPAFFDLFFGCQLAGALPVPLYPPVRLGRLDEYFARTAAMVRAVSAAAVVTDARAGKVLGRLLEQVRPRAGLLQAEALLAPEPLARPASPGPDDLAMVQFSSGTTVDPKPVALSHAACLANARAVQDALLTAFPDDPAHPHRGVSWLPLYHDMGLIGGVFPALDRPSSISLLQPEDFLARPALWLRAISREGATISPAPDFAYALCVERIRDEELEGVDLSRWVAALDGAEPIAPRTLRAFRDRFARWGLRPSALTPVYGLSEAALAVTFSPMDQPFRTLRLDPAALSRGSAVLADRDAPTTELVRLGPPLPGFEVEVRGPDGAPLPAGAIGRVWAAGPSLMAGYLDRPSPSLQGGWLDTGDLGFLWDGDLVITGRAKDLIILRGQNHAPQELERAVDAVDGVRTGCAVAVGEVGPEGERVLLLIEAREARPGLAEACRDAVRAATGVDPDLVLVLEPGTLPRTSSGKLRRGEALRQLQAGELRPPEAVTAWSLAGAMARSWAARWRHG